MTASSVEIDALPEECPIETVFNSKVRVPWLRDELVGRPRLTDSLVGSMGHLVVVSAPPGFGKTTLLAQWAALDPRPFAFVSLESTENDPAELWSSIVYSLGQIHPSTDESVEASLGSQGGLAVESIVRRVAAELEKLEQPMVLVLDDLHAIKNPTCIESLASFVNHPAGPLTIALSTRADPLIPLGRLRASGDLIEIRAADLAFTEHEIEEGVNGVAGVSLTEGDLTVLYEHTEGWPVGVHLASLGLRTSDDPAEFLRSFGGSNRYVMDYLTEVVVDALDEDLGSFLLETSILRRLNGSLCDAVTGRDDSAAMLERLYRSNVFVIPLDDDRRWYRYHHLFGELLAERLRAQFPSRVPELHKAAALWLRETGDVGEAILHSIAAGELEEATDLVSRNWSALAARGRFVTLLEWLDAFPDRYVESQARLSLPRVWAMGVMGREFEAQRSLADALRAGFDGPLPDGSGTVEQAGAMVRSRFPWGNVGELRAAARAVKTVRSSLIPPFQAAAVVGIGMGSVLSGEDLEEARVELERGVEMGTELGMWVLVVTCLGLSAHLALAEHDAEGAESFGRRASEVAMTFGLADLPHVGYFEAAYGAGVARSGRVAEGDALLEHAIAQLGDFDSLFAAHARLLHVPVRHQLGDMEGARKLLEEAKVLLEQCDDPGAIAALAVEVARAMSTSHRRGGERMEPTDREVDVLRLLEAGLSKQEIANELFLSFNTIHSHTKSLYAKLDASSRDEAIERARERGIL